MNMATKHISWMIVMVAATACGGCGGNPPPPPPPPAQVPPPFAVTPPPPAQPLACDQVALLAASTTLQARAAAEAPGMKPEGVPACAVVPEGQTYTGPMFVLEQGYCYTFLGQSLPPVAQMEMVLQADFGALAGPMLPPQMAQMAQSPILVSTTPGEKVSMAEKQNCYQWPFPLPASVKLILKSRAGSGPVSAQVFRKKKL